ncbi:MAG: serine--tRNA ligase [Actinomycetota bacterium]
MAIDLRLLRNDPDCVADSLARRGARVVLPSGKVIVSGDGAIDLEYLRELDNENRRLISEVDEARSERKRASKAIARLSEGERADAVARNKEVAEGLKALEQHQSELQEQLYSALRLLPNLVHPQAPPGKGDEASRLVRQAGNIPSFEFDPQDHLSLGESLGIIDVKRAAKVSGSRFAFLRGSAALLQTSLIRFVLDRLGAEGFVPVVPPVLVREQAMYGTGFFPTDEAQVYKTADDDLYLVGTSEVPIASMHADETFDAAELPLRYAGISTCFRREAGTYGKDTRGIIRVHQFDKVEMFSFCLPSESNDEHRRLVELEEGIFAALEVPYRLVEIAAGELADPNYRKFDIEAWLPGGDRWLEVTSCSNDWDYQARRLGIKVRGEGGTEMVHTLNGTAIAIGRAIVALLENHQQADGSVAIPEALQPYTGFDQIVP